MLTGPYLVARGASGSQKGRDLLGQFLRHLFGQEMARRHGLAPRLDRAILPRLQNVVDAMDRPSFRPQYEQRALNLFVEVRLIVGKVNRRRRAIILANGMDRIGLAKRAQIFLKTRRC